MDANKPFGGIAPFSPMANIVESAGFQRYFEKSLQEMLGKLQSFLVTEGIAQPGRVIKGLPTVVIDGDDGTGNERLIEKEFIEEYGLGELEESDAYNRVMPFVTNGVLKSKLDGVGAIYDVFEVVAQTETHFDLSIIEYRVRNGVFFANFFVYAQGVSKTAPFQQETVMYASIKELCLDRYTREELKQFSDQELDMLTHVAMQDSEAEDYCTSVLYYALSTFRCINYIRDSLRGKPDSAETFLANHHFTVKNWEEDTFTDPGEAAVTGDAQEEISRVVSEEPLFAILPRNSIGRLIPKIVKEKQITTFNCAVGFACKSGLREFLPIFDRSECSCQLVIGALQKADGDQAITKMDRASAEYINSEILPRGVTVWTYPSAFYHGKFYYMSNDDKAYIIMGSSNISKAAFFESYELDVLYVADRGSETDKKFSNWFQALQMACTQITELDCDKFHERNWDSELAAYSVNRMRRMSEAELDTKIAEIKDVDTKYRAELWRKHEPFEAYENHGVTALKDYTMFVYPEAKLVAFECLLRGNAYYVFRYTDAVEDLLNRIANLSKGLMMLLPRAVLLERGYHLKDPMEYERRIKRLFRPMRRRTGV